MRMSCNAIVPVEHGRRDFDGSHAKESLLLLQECDEWGAGNFCNSNPRFMWYACRKTCGTCFKPDLEVRRAFQGFSQGRTRSFCMGMMCR